MNFRWNQSFDYFSISDIRRIILFIPFLTSALYPFWNIYLYFLFNFLIIFSFFFVIYYSISKETIILLSKIKYFFYLFCSFIFSYAFSPIKNLISYEYVNLVSGFLIFFCVLNVEEIEIKWYYFLFFLTLLLFILDSFIDLGISQKGNLNLFAFIFMIFSAIFLSKGKYYYAILFFVAILFTKSIASIFSILMSCVFYAFDNRKNIDWKSNKIMLFIISILFLFLIIFIEPKSVFDRLSWWGSALKMFYERPIFGWGYSSFTHIVSAFSNSELKSIYPHNYFLGILAEGGIFSFIFFVVFVFLSIKKIYTIEKYIIIALLIYSFFDIGLDTVCGWWLFMFYLAYSLRNKSYVFIINDLSRKLIKFILIFTFFFLVYFVYLCYLLFDVDYIIRKSRYLLGINNYSEAVKLAEFGIKKYPSNIDIAINRANIYLSLANKEPNKIINYLKSLEYILLLNPYRRDIYYTLIKNYKNMDQDAVLDVYERMKKHIRS
ncbi:MAG: O-antigen ligase family protein [Elusimicrobiales bacterium]|nr:O-antigen ligase family protein [Elusimicrobiales bacterium]